MDNWLKLRRQELGMTQEDLVSVLQANGYNITRGAIGHWETDRNPLPFKDANLIKALSTVLRLPVPNLMKLAGFEFNTHHSDTAEAAAYLIDELPPDKQELALRLVQQLR